MTTISSLFILSNILTWAWGKEKKNIYIYIYIFRSNVWTELRKGVLNQAKKIANAIQQRDIQKTKKHCWTPAEGTPLLLAT